MSIAKTAHVACAVTGATHVQCDFVCALLNARTIRISMFLLKYGKIPFDPTLWDEEKLEAYVFVVQVAVCVKSWEITNTDIVAVLISGVVPY